MTSTRISRILYGKERAVMRKMARIELRVSPEEKALIYTEAKKQKQSVSDYVRKLQKELQELRDRIKELEKTHESSLASMEKLALSTIRLSELISEKMDYQEKSLEVSNE